MSSSPFTRRQFLQTTGLAFAGLATQNLPFSEQKIKHLALQLWSIREDMFRDPRKTLEAVAKMGYKEVEPFGHGGSKLFGLNYMDFRKALKDNGLKAPSAHIPVEIKDYDTAKKDISDDLKRTYDEAVKLGHKYVICPYMNQETRGRIKDIIPAFQAAAKYAHKIGLQWAYHNHDFEFTDKGPDGRMLYDWILSELDPAQAVMEMDLYWTVYAGQKPQDWFQKHPGRFHLCHAKDMANSPKRETIEIGDGTIDFKSIFAQRKQAGLKHFVVELEHYKTTAMEGVDRSRKGLLKLGL
ncbi:MAG: sugar phosphate isomerase/epimerase [Saprospiraceae bacterium]|nr:sugar phosphate isomerase/epimerase [Saprospiraceae bacterium]